MKKLIKDNLNYWDVKSPVSPKRERSQSSLLYKEAKKLGLLKSPILRPTKAPEMPIEPLELPPLEVEYTAESIDFSEDSASAERYPSELKQNYRQVKTCPGEWSLLEDLVLEEKAAKKSNSDEDGEGTGGSQWGMPIFDFMEMSRKSSIVV